MRPTGRGCWAALRLSISKWLRKVNQWGHRSLYGRYSYPSESSWKPSSPPDPQSQDLAWHYPVRLFLWDRRKRLQDICKCRLTCCIGKVVHWSSPNCLWRQQECSCLTNTNWHCQNCRFGSGCRYYHRHTKASRVATASCCSGTAPSAPSSSPRPAPAISSLPESR